MVGTQIFVDWQILMSCSIPLIFMFHVLYSNKVIQYLIFNIYNFKFYFFKPVVHWTLTALGHCYGVNCSWQFAGIGRFQCVPRAGEGVDKLTRKQTEISEVWLGQRVSKLDKQALGRHRSRKTPGQKEGRHNGSLKSKESNLESGRILESRGQDKKIGK